MEQSLQFTYSKPDLVLKTSSWQQPGNKSKFDQVLMSRWDNAATNGCFRYTLEHLQTKVIPGHMKYIAQLNTKRATDRRKPQEMQSLAQPFNPNQFNFTKVKDHEVLIELCQVSQEFMQIKENGVSEANDSITEEHTVNGVADSDPYVNSRHFKDSTESSAKRQTTSNKHMVIINVSPFEYCNVLLVPNMESGLPQVLTKEAIQIALEMLLLSSKRGFRVCWSSLCAFASVNHLHFHAYYLQQEMKIETVPTQLVHGPCHELVDWPARGFIFQLEGTDVESLASSAFTVAHHLHKNEIAHNLFLTRGAPLGTEAAMSNNNVSTQIGQETVRVILWPRKSSFGAKRDDVFNIAVCELAGHLPIYTQEGYDSMTEERVIHHVKAVSLSQEEFDSLKEDAKALL